LALGEPLEKKKKRMTLSSPQAEQFLAEGKKKDVVKRGRERKKKSNWIKWE